MPERYVLVRWPEGPVQRIYSPSTVVEDYFSAGDSIPVGDFLKRSRAALTVASERVRAAYGFPCGRSAASIVAIEQHAARHPSGDVRVEAIES